MGLIATLIANPSNPVLAAALGEEAARRLRASGLYWLADGIACDIALADGQDEAEAAAILEDLLSGLAIDKAIQPARPGARSF